MILIVQQIHILTIQSFDLITNEWDNLDFSFKIGYLLASL